MLQLLLINTVVLIDTVHDISVKIIHLFNCGEVITLECRESDVSPAKTEVKQGKFVSFISPAKGYFRETYKSPNIKIVSEYDQEIPQSQTADNPMVPRGRAHQSSRDTRKTN